MPQIAVKLLRDSRLGRDNLEQESSKSQVTQALSASFGSDDAAEMRVADKPRFENRRPNQLIAIPLVTLLRVATAI
jgi:hypothetical protein